MKPYIQYLKRSDDIKLAYSVFGEGPPLVIASPWVTNLVLYLEEPFISNFWTEISKSCTVVIYDKHGCGLSDRNRTIFDIESELFDLQSVIEHLRLDKVILYGNSMAGATAILYAAQNQQSVSHLILYAAYADGKKLASEDVRSAIISLVKASWGMGSKTLADLFIPEAPSDWVNVFTKYQKESASPEIAGRIIELIYSLDVTEILHKIEIPTLVLHREKDAAIKFSHGKELAHSLPNAKLKVLGGKVHFPYYEEPEAIIEEIITFISGDQTFNKDQPHENGKKEKADYFSAIQKERGAFKRKLAAILSADAKGYSRLMAANEIQTIQSLKAYRQIMSDRIRQYSGRVVDTPGDNLLADFASAVDAVECAVAIQKKLKKENAKFDEDKRLQFRIGVNIGDIVQDGDRIYGSGVNVSARIEGIADPGGICISRNTYDHVKDKLDLGFEYLGEHEVKNINEPVRVYKVLKNTDAQKPLVEEKLELPDKPSIAVLPFTNMSGDSEQEYFSDGITEDIITALSRSPWLFVISRNSTFIYKGSAVDVRSVSRELGVRYILEGSVRKTGNRIRLTAQLIDGINGSHVWGENYDGVLEDIFDLQDKLTQQVVASVQSKIQVSFGDKTKSVESSDVTKWSLLAKAWSLIYDFTAESLKSAEKISRKVIENETTSCEAYTLLSASLFHQVVMGYVSDNIDMVFLESFEAAKRAVFLDEKFEFAHLVLGLNQQFRRKYDLAIAEFERAIELNPNLSVGYGFLGGALSLIGKSDEAIKNINFAIRLSPLDSAIFFRYTDLAFAHFMAGRYSEAIIWARRSIQIKPSYRYGHIYLIVSLVSLNKLEEAKEAVKIYLEHIPNDTISRIHKDAMGIEFKGFLLILESLRKAGLPD